MKQMSFGFNRNYKKEFGGSLVLGKRKTARPLSTKHPIHLILKADHKNLFSPSNLSLSKLIRSQANKFGIKLNDLAINWSHIHFLIQIKSRKDYNKFIRSLTSIMTARIRAKFPNLETIFTLRPFTRIVSWGRDFNNALDYVVLNQMESYGLIRRKKRRSNIKIHSRKETKHEDSLTQKKSKATRSLKKNINELKAK